MKNLPAWLVSSLVIIMLASSIVEGQAPRPSARAAASIRLPASLSTNRVAPAAAANSRRSSQLICTLSSFFSFDPSNQVADRTTLDGRGLLNCQNDSGFATELPVLADLEIQLPADFEATGETAISAESSSFVIQREVNQIQDSYVVRAYAQPTLSFRGQKNDLVIEMKINSRTGSMSDIKITGMRLRFDENAPDLF